MQFDKAIMLAIPRKKHNDKVTVHALPCKLHYNGPVDAAKHFKPETDEHGSPTVYFRGRKLRGRTIELPRGYEGTSLSRDLVRRVL